MRIGVPVSKEIDVVIADALDTAAELADRHRAFGEIVSRFQDMAFACAYAILNDFYLAEYELLG